VVEALELDQPHLVTLSELDRIVRQARIATPAKVVAARLRARGWLLATGQRGVWEFSPGAHAGAYSRGEVTLPLQAALARRPELRAGLTFQAAAWAHGLADRAPARLEVAAANPATARILASVGHVVVHTPVLPMVDRKSVPVLAAASVLVHLAARPTQVRSWASTAEWLPDLAAEVDADAVLTELADRSAAVRVRTGYLLQNLRPDIAGHLTGDVAGKVWFGPRGPLRRHDARWQVADTILPFPPAHLTATDGPP
jgi:hypothetical protein